MYFCLKEMNVKWVLIRNDEKIKIFIHKQLLENWISAKRFQDAGRLLA
jgi:hypothetical protein